MQLSDVTERLIKSSAVGFSKSFFLNRADEPQCDQRCKSKQQKCIKILFFGT